jgi:hypothetical protein
VRTPDREPDASNFDDVDVDERPCDGAVFQRITHELFRHQAEADPSSPAV